VSLLWLTVHGIPSPFVQALLWRAAEQAALASRMQRLTGAHTTAGCLAMLQLGGTQLRS
jgi:hypothetical protein